VFHRHFLLLLWAPSRDPRSSGAAPALEFTLTLWNLNSAFRTVIATAMLSTGRDSGNAASRRNVLTAQSIGKLSLSTRYPPAFSLAK
jgi:hypothetical protein